MHSLLIVDGHDYTEPAEADLVQHIAWRSGKFDEPQCYESFISNWNGKGSNVRWSVVWFAGHSTIYKKAHRGYLEERRGSQFHRIASTAQVKQIDTRLLVLSSCNTSPLHDGPFSASRLQAPFYRAGTVIGHKGAVRFDDALVFCARFFGFLCRNMRRDRIERAVLDEAFRLGKKAAGAEPGCGWHIYHTEDSE